MGTHTEEWFVAAIIETTLPIGNTQNTSRANKVLPRGIAPPRARYAKAKKGIVSKHKYITYLLQLLQLLLHYLLLLLH